jgi:uncharacterized protein
MSENRSGLTGIAIIMVGVVLSSYLLGSSVVKARANNSEIRVTGSARKDIDSDFIVWTGRVTYRAENMTAGYQSVKTAVTKLVDYLKAKGIKETELSIGAVTTNALYEQQATGQYDGGSAFRTIKGYDVSQGVTVRSGQVELVEKVSRESTDLIPQGVPLESSNPQFIYTKIGEVKREILGLAAEDARKRGEEIASKSGGNIGDVRGARMAPLQITPRYDFDIYDSGYNDLTSKEKSITAVVTLTFGVN